MSGLSRLGAGALLAAALGGCVAARSQTAAVPTGNALPTTVARPSPRVGSDQRTVAYPQGRWQLYGDGTAASPYAWVWIPTGATPPLMAPAR
jgi:hypothetical protein